MCTEADSQLIILHVKFKHIHWKVLQIEVHSGTVCETEINDRSIHHTVWNTDQARSIFADVATEWSVLSCIREHSGFLKSAVSVVTTLIEGIFSAFAQIIWFVSFIGIDTRS